MWYILFFIGLALLGSAAYAAASGAPWVPTHKRDLERIARLLDLQKGDRVVELGCGNGRVCRDLARRVPEARVEGIELSVLQYLIAVVQAKLAGSPARFHLKNVFKKNLSEYDAVYLFLMPETYEKIQPKLEKELKSGARVVSYVWPIPGWEPVEVDEEEGRLKLYLYIRC